jgi:hypothetical protein
MVASAPNVESRQLVVTAKTTIHRVEDLAITFTVVLVFQCNNLSEFHIELIDHRALIISQRGRAAS